MGKKKRVRAAAELDIAKGSGKKFEKKESKAGKVIAVIAGILAVVVVLGTLAWFYLPNIISGSMTAIESDNYEVTSPMLTYFFNSNYQGYVSSYNSYLSYIGLDVTKSLKDQTTQDGQTWYDFFMNNTTSTVEDMLALCEAAKADDKFDADDEIEKSVDEAVATMESQAKSNNVNLEYYLKAVYGNGVNEKVLRKCLTLQETASRYSQELTGRYEFAEADWDKYYEDNKDTFRKVDYLKYTFSVTATTVADDATEEEKEAASQKDKAEAERLRGVAEGLAATTGVDGFKGYVENYLRNDKYKDQDDAALAEQSIDIPALVDGCLSEGNTYSESDTNKWLFDEARKGYETYTEEADTSYAVYMILPAEESDIGAECMYRDTYALKNFRYIPALKDDFGTVEAAKTFADSALEEYKKDATEENFAVLAAEDKYGDGKYEGGLVENGDKGVLCDAVDEWLNDSARKAGDCEIIEDGENGYYIVYFVGNGDLKWQNTADNGLISAKYDEELATLKEKYEVSKSLKAIKIVKEVDLSGLAETTASN